MPRKPSGEEKRYIVRQKRASGDVYVYERKVVYDSNAHKNKVLGSRLIGKIPNGEGEVVPTRARRSKENPDTLSTTRPVIEASRRRTGMMDILSYVGESSGIDALLYKCTDRGTAQKIISVARYLVAEDGGSLPGIEIFQLNHWDGLAYDSTTIGTYSSSQPEARYGHNKDGDGLKVIKLLVLYAVSTRQPVAFAKQAGNISDVVTIRNALKQLAVLGMNSAVIIADNGYYSQANIADMCLAGFQFLTPVKTSLLFVRRAIDASIGQLDSLASVNSSDPDVRGTTIMRMEEFSRPRRYASKAKDLPRGSLEKIRRRVYLHIYFSSARKAADDTKLDQSLIEIRDLLMSGVPADELQPSMRKKAATYLVISMRGGKMCISYNDQAYQKARRYHGFFVFISNYKLDTWEALRTYHTRQTIEVFFDVFKNGIADHRVRVWTPDCLLGRLFVQFVALCYYEYFAQRIRTLRAVLGETTGDDEHDTEENLKAEKKLRTWLRNTSVHLILKWFDVIETTTVVTPSGTKRWSSETTARDELFLRKLGMTF